MIEKQPTSLRFFSLSLAFLAIFSMTLFSCGHHYEFKAVPIRPMSAYPGKATLGDLSVGAAAIYDSAELTRLFGFDLKDAGVIPVQLLVANAGKSDVVVLEGSTLQDEAGNLWEVLPSGIVYQRLNDYTSGSLSGEKGAKRTLLWGLAGAIVGAAAGIASGTNVGEAAGTGAAVGAAAGAATSVLGMGTTQDSSEAINRDFSGRDLEHATVSPGVDANGFLYFPAESKRPTCLNLKVSVGKKVETLRLNF
jgi:hypothetical protein